MGLMKCPDCGREVSDRAETCVHCGGPLVRARLEQGRYALVLTTLDFNYPDMFRLLAQFTGATEEEARTMASQLPLVLRRDLGYAEVFQLAGELPPDAATQVVRMDDLDRLSEAQPVPPPGPPPVHRPREPLGFWKTVGSLLMAFLLWSSAALFVQWLIFWCSSRS